MNVFMPEKTSAQHHLLVSIFLKILRQIVLCL